jgi:hypothetical protein
MSAATPQNDNRSLGQLFSDLVTETRTLVRQEVALAKTEVTEKATWAGRNAGVAAAGGLILLLGALPIIAGIIISLGHKIGYATASFVIGILFLIAGAVLVMKALKAFKTQPLAPTQTTTQLKETTQWAKEQIR